MELTSRMQLPPSTSTFSGSSDTQGHLDPEPDKSVSSSYSSEVPTDASALPPVDRGVGAWSFLAAAFVVEGIVWAFPFAYGIFLDDYLQDPHFTSQNNATTLLPLIGTLSSGIIYCSGPVVNSFAARYPHHRRKSMWFGALLCCGTLVGASYATEIWQLILLQGVLYAIGASLLYLPCISFMSEWFVARRGMANGIIFSGTAVAGLLLPLALPALISKYGASKTLRMLGITIGILLSLVLPFLKGRVPIQRPAAQGARIPSRAWAKHKSFWIFLAANTLQGFAFFVPIAYLPTFAYDLHISSFKSAVTLGMLNFSGVVGGISMGYLSDRFNPWTLALANLLTTSLATFVLWGVCSHSLAGLLVFGIVYGSIAGGWSSLWTGFVRPLAKDDPGLSTMLYGYLLLSRGIGNIVSTPISAKLLVYSQSPNITSHGESTGFDVGNGRFEKVIIYVGTCFGAAAALSALGLAMNVRSSQTGPSRSQ
ncbi:MFS general substrate transporter [Mycena galopus ATCC 62051]|nr:MFS general substrate transporter [Mycena galopus ATCC 62051]